MAARLTISEYTANDHIKAVLAKTGARSRQLLLARGLGEPKSRMNADAHRVAALSADLKQMPYQRPQSSDEQRGLTERGQCGNRRNADVGISRLAKDFSGVAHD